MTARLSVSALLQRHAEWSLDQAANAVEALREHACDVLNETFCLTASFVNGAVEEARKSADPTAAIDLIGVLSNLCEDAYCSTWDTGTVNAVRAGKPCRVGHYDLTESDIAEAHALADRCGGWWMDAETPPEDPTWLRFVDLRRWCACGDRFASGINGATETECVNCVVGRGEDAPTINPSPADSSLIRGGER